MISTGIEELDQRLGGLLAGRYYVVSGAPHAGKTSIALHFLGAGLEAGETCAILTQEDPGDLIAHAEFLGYDVRTPAEKGQLIVLQYRLDFADNITRLSDPDRLLEEVRNLFGEEQPTRFVVDSISPFVDTSGTAHDPLAGLVHLLDNLEATTFLTASGELSDSRFSNTSAPIRTDSAGIFHVQVTNGQLRELTFRKVRQAASRTDPFRFTIRPGLGVVPTRENARSMEEVAPELRRRLVVLNIPAKLPGNVRSALEDVYEVQAYGSVESAFAELSVGDFGVLMIVIDPRTPAPAISLTRELRRSGHGYPIVFVSATEDLRASTRAKAFRAGADAFLAEELALYEFLERMEATRVRGHRVPTGPEAADNCLVQPTDDEGTPVLLEEDEVRRAVRHQIGRSSHPFFALLFLRPPDFAPEIWRSLCEELRVREGDLVGRLPDARLVVYLHDVSRRDVRELLGRVVEAHPEVAMVEDVVVLGYPADRDDVEAWLVRTDSLQGAEADE